MSDAIGPAYAQLLTVAAQLLASPRDMPLFWSLWPNGITPVEPWAAAYQGFFRHVASLPVLRQGNQWIRAKDAVLVENNGYDNDISNSDNSDRSSSSDANQLQLHDKAQPPSQQASHDAHRLLSLREVLTVEGLPVVAVPPLLCKALVSQGAVRAQAGPAFVRHHFKATTPAGSAARADSSSALTLSTWLTPREVALHPCIDPAQIGVDVARRHALLLLVEACRDLHLNLNSDHGSASGSYANRTYNSSSSSSSQYSDARGGIASDPERFRVLHGLGLLPLANGSMGRLCVQSQSSVAQVGLLNGVEFEDGVGSEATSDDGEDNAQLLFLVEGASAHKLMAALSDVVVR